MPPEAVADVAVDSAGDVLSHPALSRHSEFVGTVRAPDASNLYAYLYRFFYYTHSYIKKGQNRVYSLRSK